MRRAAFLSTVAPTQTVRRTRERIRRAREEVMLISLQAAASASSPRTVARRGLMPGDFACYDSTRPYTLNFEYVEQLVLHMPREAMMGGSAAPKHGPRGGWRAQAGRLAGAAVRAAHGLDRFRHRAGDGEPPVETCLSLVTAALGERLGEIGQGGSSTRTALIFPRQGDHREPSARSPLTPKRSPSLSAFRRAMSRTCFTRAALR